MHWTEFQDLSGSKTHFKLRIKHSSAEWASLGEGSPREPFMHRDQSLYPNTIPALSICMMKRGGKKCLRSKKHDMFAEVRLKKSLWGPGSSAERKTSSQTEETKGREGGGEGVAGRSAKLQSALRTPTNIHVNCSLGQINKSDKLPIPLSGL